MDGISAFCELAKSPGNALKQFELPYNYPLLLSGIEKVKSSKFNGAIAEARVIGEEIKNARAKITWHDDIQESTMKKIEGAEEKLRREIECIRSMKDLEVPTLSKTQLEIAKSKRGFRFFLPKRLAELLYTNEKGAAQIERTQFVCCMAGIRSKTICMATVPLGAVKRVLYSEDDEEEIVLEASSDEEQASTSVGKCKRKKALEVEDSN